MKNPHFGIESIRLMAEGANIAEPTSEVAASLSEEVTLKLAQLISRASKFMSHANRTKLTCADINKALKWSDCQPVFGHECNPNNQLRYSYSTEAKVFRYNDEIVDLVAQTRLNNNQDLKLITDRILAAKPQIKIEEEI